MSTLDDADRSVKRVEGQEFECEDEVFAQNFPGIYEWLARVMYKGKPRETASLTIKYRSGGVSLCLSAPQEKLVGWHQDKTIDEALEGLEKRLQARAMDWRERKEGYQRR